MTRQPVFWIERVPVHRTLSPPEMLSALPGGPGRILLESALWELSLAGGPGAPCPGAARWSFAAAEPFAVLTGSDEHFTLTQPGSPARLSRDPFTLLDWMFEQHPADRPPEGAPPFTGGAAGFLAYDLGRLIEHLPSSASPGPRIPDICLSFYELVIALDHRDSSLWLAGTVLPGREPVFRQRLRRWKEALVDRSRRISRAPSPPLFKTDSRLVSTFDRAGYELAVTRALEHIAAGDVFQVNLSQRFSAALDPRWGQDPGWRIYLRLRETAPAPFAAYLHGPGFEVASVSPERFLSAKQFPGQAGYRRVETRPIKGTRPRGPTPELDASLARELLQSEKDRAELVMIVDLERNDLGRVAATGSVRVSELRRLESFPTVHHTVSTIEAALATDLTPGQLLKATFPSGSVTGAPKIRAMEIIETLEPVRRHVYCGSIGYLSFHGGLDLNVAIRTVTVTDRCAFFHAGGGIVADSDPAAEFEETLAKARGLAQALGLSLPKGAVICTSGSAASPATPRQPNR